MGQKLSQEEKAFRATQSLMSDLMRCANHQYCAPSNFKTDLPHLIWKLDMIFSKVGIDPNEDDMMTVAIVHESSMLSSWTTSIWSFHWSRFKKNLEAIEWAVPANSNVEDNVICGLYTIRKKLHELDATIKDERPKK